MPINGKNVKLQIVIFFCCQKNVKNSGIQQVKSDLGL